MLILPWILSSTAYGEVFGFIAIVQLLSLFSSLGLEVAAGRENLPHTITLPTIALTTLAATIVYEFTHSEQHSIATAALIFTTTFANNASLIIQNRYMFSGDANRYAGFGSARAATMVIVLLAGLRMGTSPIVGWALASLASVVLPHLLLEMGTTRRNTIALANNPQPLKNLLPVLGASLPMAALNSLASLPFVAERLIAKYSFSAELFPRYAICSTLLTPLAYLGNMSQNYLISHHRWIDKRATFGGALLLLGLGGAYLGILFVGTIFILPPFYSTTREFYEVVAPCGIWVLFYCTTAFPLAAVTQKQVSGSTLAKCATASIAAVLMLYACYEVATHQKLQFDRPWKVAIASFLLGGAVVSIRAIYVWPLTRLRAAP